MVYQWVKHLTPDTVSVRLGTDMDQHLPICLINKELSHNIESWNQFVNYWSSGSCQGGDKPQSLTMAGYDISSESM